MAPRRFLFQKFGKTLGSPQVERDRLQEIAAGKVRSCDSGEFKPKKKVTAGNLDEVPESARKEDTVNTDDETSAPKLAEITGTKNESNINDSNKENIESNGDPALNLENPEPSEVTTTEDADNNMESSGNDNDEDSSDSEEFESDFEFDF